MVSLSEIVSFARSCEVDWTTPLSHDEVAALADYWCPSIKFDPREFFHPIRLEELVNGPTEEFASLSMDERERLMLDIRVRGADGTLAPQPFQPPVLRRPDGDGWVVLGSGTEARGAFDLFAPEQQMAIDGQTVCSHGPGIDRSRALFGAKETVLGTAEPSSGNPRKPRRNITVIAEFRTLWRALKHELDLDRPDRPGDPNKRLDAIWSGFDIEDVFFYTSGGGSLLPFSREDKRAALKALVVAYEAGLPLPTDEHLPAGHHLNERAWRASLDYSFLEFNFVYAYNDLTEYQDSALIANQHEGDIEGCCVVFANSVLEAYAPGLPVAQATPHTIMTSAHESGDGLDSLRKLGDGSSEAGAAAVRAELNVYVAAGSHATYLSPGSHDLLTFETMSNYVTGKVPWWGLASAIAGIPSLIWLGPLIGAVIEHFEDAEDQTSDDGVVAGASQPAPGPAEIVRSVQVTPLSSISTGINVYDWNLPGAPPLAVRAFPGKWGGTPGGLVDHSPNWSNKTGRFFRLFVQRGEISLPLVG